MLQQSYFQTLEQIYITFLCSPILFYLLNQSFLIFSIHTLYKSQHIKTTFIINLMNKSFLLIFFIYFVSTQYITNFNPPPPDNNPKFSPYWYKSDCCPKLQLAKSIQYLNNNKDLINTYNHIRYNRCPCTHFILAIDKSGSMWNIWTETENTLNFWAGILPSSFYYMSYYFFDNVAYIPEYLHVDPFSPVPFPYSTGGLTNFNAAIYRAIQIVNLYLNENTCFLMISDGGGNFNYPQPILTLLARMNEIRKRGCWTCRVCFYIKPAQGSQSGEYKVFEELCKRLEAPFIESTIKTYREVIPSTIKSLVGNRGVLKQ